MTDPGSGTGPTVRLVFEYQDDEVRLVQQTTVDTAPTGPPHDPSAPGEFVEVLTEAEVPIARAVVAPGIGTGVEVFPENHSDPITRTDMPDRQGAFTVVIGAPAAADHVNVVRVRPGTAPSGERAAPGAPPPPETERVELGSFPLLPR